VGKGQAPEKHCFDASLPDQGAEFIRSNGQPYAAGPRGPSSKAERFPGGRPVPPGKRPFSMST
jgi:hypothetical protein